MNPIYFFELSGEAGDMPREEAVSCAYAETAGDVETVSHGPGYVILKLPSDSLSFISERLALTRGIGRYLGSFAPGDVDSFAPGNLPEGTFAIRGKRFRGMMSDINSQKIIRKVGDVFSENNPVDLDDPEIVVRMFMSDKVHFFVEEYRPVTDLFEKRKVSERPFFSPISLHPKYARALINLTGAARGSTVLDPFCGTGGIAIEAAKMGMKAIVSDFDPQMVAGTAENMHFYNLELADSDVLDIGDIAERWSGIDVVVTDPPYGRSTKTGGENLSEMYARSFKSISGTLRTGGSAGMIFPKETGTEHLTLEKVLPQRVHGSLTRYYHIFRK